MPLDQYCCSICGACAPKKYLKHGKLSDRIRWLRQHYASEHPRRFSQWGKK